MLNGWIETLIGCAIEMERGFLYVYPSSLPLFLSPSFLFLSPSCTFSLSDWYFVLTSSSSSLLFSSEVMQTLLLLLTTLPNTKFLSFSTLDQVWNHFLFIFKLIYLDFIPLDFLNLCIFLPFSLSPLSLLSLSPFSPSFSLLHQHDIPLSYFAPWQTSSSSLLVHVVGTLFSSQHDTLSIINSLLLFFLLLHRSRCI